MAKAHRCNDLILVMQSVDGCSRASTISVDPCEVPGAELWLSKLSIRPTMAADSLIIGIGALKLGFELPAGCKGLPDFDGKLETEAEEDASIGGLETRT